MSEEQIAKILKRLDQQDLTLKIINQKLDELEPVRQAFNSVVGFDRIAVWIIKFLLGFAALIGAGYTILHFLRKLLIKEL